MNYLGARMAKLVPDLSHTIVRFPVSCMVALISFFIVNLDIGKLINLFTGNEERVYLSLAAAFLASGAGHLFAEGRNWPRLRGAFLAAVAAAVFGTIYLFNEVTGADPLFLFSGTALLVMTSPYLRNDVSENALWLFNARFGLAALLAFVVSIVFCGGLTAIMASLDYLFDVSIRGRYYEHVWASGATLIGPVYGLSLMPRDLDEQLQFAEPPSLLDRGISVLISYILAPMILVYLIILYMYAGKIALEWSLPKGQIGIMVLLFGLGGTATYLVARPWRERGTRVLGWFLSSWFWLTIVPVGLLAIAVYRRLSDYGVTPERYGLVVIGVWLAAMVVYFSVYRRRAVSRTIMLSLGVLLLAGSVGFWGARDLSIASQLGRLQALLVANGYLENGKLLAVIPGANTISPETSSDGASIINFLRKTDALDKLKPLFTGRYKDPFTKEYSKWSVAAAINEQFGFRDFGRAPDGGHNVYFNGTQAVTTQLDGGLVLHGPLSANSYGTKSKAIKAQSPEVAARLESNQLIITRGADVWRAEAMEILRLSQQQSQTGGNRYRAFEIKANGSNGVVKVIVTGTNGQLGGKNEKMRSMNFWAVLPGVSN